MKMKHIAIILFMLMFGSAIRAADLGLDSIRSGIDSAVGSISDPLNEALGIKSEFFELGTNDSDVFFEIGGALPLEVDTTGPGLEKTISLNAGLSLSSTASCGLYDFDLSLTNLVNGATEGVRDVFELVQSAITSFVTSLPLYILQKIDQDLFNILGEFKKNAEIVHNLQVTSCEDMTKRLMENGLSEYQFLVTRDASNNVRKSVITGQADIVQEMRKAKEAEAKPEDGVECPCGKVAQEGKCFSDENPRLVVATAIDCAITKTEDGGLKSADTIISDTIAFGVLTQNLSKDEVFVPSGKQPGNIDLKEDVPVYVSQWVGDINVKAGETTSSVTPAFPRNIFSKNTILCRNAMKKLIDDKLAANEFQVTEEEARAVVNCQGHETAPENLLFVREMGGVSKLFNDMFTQLSGGAEPSGGERGGMITLMAADAARHITVNQIAHVQHLLIVSKSTASFKDTPFYTDIINEKLKDLDYQAKRLNDYFAMTGLSSSNSIMVEIRSYLNRTTANAAITGRGTNTGSFGEILQKENE